MSYKTSQTSLMDLSLAVGMPYGSISSLHARNRSYAIFEFQLLSFVFFCDVEKSAKFKDCATVHGLVSVLNESKLPIHEAVALCFLYPQDTCSTKVLAGGCSFVCRTVTVFSADLPGYGHENKLVRLFLYCIGWA